MRVVQSRTRYTQSEADRATLAAAVNALLAKRDMLVQISATKTAELRRPVSTRHQPSATARPCSTSFWRGEHEELDLARVWIRHRFMPARMLRNL